MKLSVGVDLHKTQFTVFLLSEDRKETGFGKYLTNKKGYKNEDWVGLGSGHGNYLKPLMKDQELTAI